MSVKPATTGGFPTSPSFSTQEPFTPSKRAPIVDRSRANPEIVKAAEGMEGMFLDYMMKVMRQTVPKGELDLESPATDIYRGMLDSEYAQIASHQGGIGLADQIIAYLDPQQYYERQGIQEHKVPAKEKP
jgi:flagellar protein FlgJ